MRLLLTCILTVFLSGLNAQTNDPLLDKVKQHYASISGFSAEFTQTLTDATGDEFSFSGNLKISDDKFHIQMEEQTLISNGNTIWVYYEDVNEVIISPMEDDGSELMRPSYYFSIPTDNFLYRKDETVMENGKTYEKYRFSPKDKSMNFHTLMLWIDPTTNTIQKAEVTDKEQQKIKFEISNQKNQSFSASAFEFSQDKHPGVIVTDNR